MNQNVEDLNSYEIDKQLFLENPKEFWNTIAKNNIYWDKEYDNVLGGTDENPLWFENGKLNACYNTVDKHAFNPETRDKIAIVHENPSMGITNSLTYLGLYDRVCEFSTALRSLGLTSGDKVFISMPNSLYGIIAMLSCVRIGAIHCVVYDGYAPKHLAIRNDLLKPKIIIAANIRLNENEALLNYDDLKQTLELSKHKVDHIIIQQRNDIDLSIYNFNQQQKQIPRNFIDWDELVKSSTNNFANINRDYTPVDSNHPICILFTSGTTGEPKGIVRNTAGYIVSLSYHLRNTFNIKSSNDIFFSRGGIGWVSGQSLVVYGSLLCGIKTIAFEGDIMKPHIGVLWELISKHKVNILHIPTSTTRAFQAFDPNGDHVKKYDISSLRYVISGGEKINKGLSVYLTSLTKIRMVEDYWSTEAGCPMVSNPGRYFNIPPGVTGAIVPGNNLFILNSSSEQCKVGEVGELVVKMPLPPNFVYTLLNNHDRYIKSYLSKHKGYFATGDLANKTSDGFINVISRVEDILNINQWEIPVSTIESIIYSHSAISECSVVVIKNGKGDMTLGFAVLNSDFPLEKIEQLQKEVSLSLNRTIGEIVCFQGLIFLNRLPKTRSGKVYRKLLDDIFNGVEFDIPSCLENELVIQEIKQAFRIYNLTM